MIESSRPADKLTFSWIVCKREQLGFKLFDWCNLGVYAMLCVCVCVLLRSAWLVACYSSNFLLQTLFPLFCFFSPTVISFLFSTLCTSAFSWWCSGSQFALPFSSSAVFKCSEVISSVSCATWKLLFRILHDILYMFVVTNMPASVITFWLIVL